MYLSDFSFNFSRIQLILDFSSKLFVVSFLRVNPCTSSNSVADTNIIFYIYTPMPLLLWIFILCKFCLFLTCIIDLSDGFESPYWFKRAFGNLG